jgi:hypothetical protein
MDTTWGAGGRMEGGMEDSTEAVHMGAQMQVATTGRQHMERGVTEPVLMARVPVRDRINRQRRLSQVLLLDILNNDVMNDVCYDDCYARFIRSHCLLHGLLELCCVLRRDGSAGLLHHMVSSRGHTSSRRHCAAT